MELIKVGEKTLYIKNNTNIGIYKVNDNDVFLIDTGNDKEAGRKILKLLNENNLNVIGIINTHSNADHVGGNKIIQDRTNALIYSCGIETCFINYPILEPSFLYGGYPFKALQNKFLMAKESNSINIKDLEGLEYFKLKGHFFDMIGIKTSDDVYFLGDSLFSEDVINKYHIFFIYDVKAYLETLDFLSTLKGTVFIPSHVEATNNIKNLIEINRNKINEIINNLLSICKVGKTLENILKEVLDYYKLLLNETQYVLIESTIKSYLSYLIDENKIEYYFNENKLYFRTIL